MLLKALGRFYLVAIGTTFKHLSSHNLTMYFFYILHLLPRGTTYITTANTSIKTNIQKSAYHVKM